MFNFILAYIVYMIKDIYIGMIVTIVLFSLNLLKFKSKLRKRVVLDRKISRSKRCLTFLIREPYKMMIPPLIMRL